jgi:hypothetical protein
MVTQVLSAALDGLEAHPVSIEISAENQRENSVRVLLTTFTILVSPYDYTLWGLF